MRAVKPGIWLRARSNLAEATPQRWSRPRLSLVPLHHPIHAARRRVAENRWLAVAILGLCLFVVALVIYVFNPTVSTLVGGAAEPWNSP